MYKITIEKIETEKVTKQGEYGIIEKRPYTQEEMDTSYHGFEQEANQLKEIRGYKPSYEVVREKTTQILEQTVDNLDVKKVLIAINEITKEELI